MSIFPSCDSCGLAIDADLEEHYVVFRSRDGDVYVHTDCMNKIARQVLKDNPDIWKREIYLPDEFSSGEDIDADPL